MKLETKLLGALSGAAIGSAMGAPVISMPIDMIQERFGGKITDFVGFPPEKNTKDLPGGLVTDGFTLAAVHAEYWGKYGHLTDENVAEALEDWRNNPKYRHQVQYFIGKTTQAALARRDGSYTPTFADEMLCDQKTITNGAAAKSWICGLFHPADPYKAMLDTFTLCLPTHNNVIALAGACAVSSALAVALTGSSDINRIVEAGIYGARDGYAMAMDRAKAAAGASVAERIKLAVTIGLKYGHRFDECIREMEGVIGTGPHANESVPSAFGFFVASGGNVRKAIELGVNAGNDSDVVASLAGALAGAYGGYDKSLASLADHVSAVNGINLNRLTRTIISVIDRRNQ